MSLSAHPPSESSSHPPSESSSHPPSESFASFEEIVVINKRLWQDALDSIVEPPSPRFAPLDAADLAVVMVEFRTHEWLRATLWNIAHVYSSCSPSTTSTSTTYDAALVVVCGRANAAAVRGIVGGWLNVVVRVLDRDNCTIPEYNQLMTNAELYSLVDPCPAMLLTQTDTLTRKRAPKYMFQTYGYVGSPWIMPQKGGPINGLVGNGGYSLRNVALMKEACTSYAYDHAVDKAEDLFFAKRCKNVAPALIAKSFSVEHVAHEDPCGMHQAWRFHRTSWIARWLKDLPGTVARDFLHEAQSISTTPQPTNPGCQNALSTNSTAPTTPTILVGNNNHVVARKKIIL